MDGNGAIVRFEASIAAFTLNHEKITLASQLQAAGLQAFAVLDALELADDPHLRARGFFGRVQAGDKDCPLPGTPLVATPPMSDPVHPAPRPGEHSDEIRAELATFEGLKL